MLEATIIYQLLQGVVCGLTIYDACDTLGFDREELERNLNDIELRSLILEISMRIDSKGRRTRYDRWAD